MKIAYFDCFSGISGDMFVASLIDAGLDFNFLKNELAKLCPGEYSIDAFETKKKCLRGTKFNVEEIGEQKQRGLKDIIELYNKSTLEQHIKEQCIAVFTRLAEVEARVHGIDVEEIHFHEVGAVDSIVDITAAIVGLHLLQIDAVYASQIALGHGFVETMHGKLPVPAPATAALLHDVPVYSTGIEAELVTPTGAALITTFARGFGTMPAMKITDIGYGAGTKDLETPNMVRVFIGEKKGLDDVADEVLILETNIDDMNPELFGYISDLLIARGALDVYTVPVIMKKSRPGVVLTVITVEEKKMDHLNIIFAETTTAGVRERRSSRYTLKRSFVSVVTKYGEIKIKVLESEGVIVTISPEYEDCKKAAIESGASLKDVYDEARHVARGQGGLSVSE